MEEKVFKLKDLEGLIGHLLGEGCRKVFTSGVSSLISSTLIR